MTKTDIFLILLIVFFICFCIHKIAMIIMYKQYIKEQEREYNEFLNRNGDKITEEIINAFKNKKEEKIKEEKKEVKRGRKPKKESEGK